MADTVQSIGLGTTAWFDDGSSHAYAQVFNLVSVGPGAPKLNTLESKTLNGGTTIKKIAALFDGGELSIKQQFTNAGWTRAEALRLARVPCHVKIVIADDASGSTIIAAVLVTQNKPDTIEADKITEFDTVCELTDVETES